MISSLFQSLRRKLSKGSGKDVVIVLVIRLLAIGSTYLAMYLILNWGHIADWGRINLIISIVNIICVISTFGLPTLIMKNYPITAISDRNKELKNIIQIVVLFTSVIVLLLLPFKHYFINDVFKLETDIPAYVYIMFLLLIPVFSFKNIFSSLFRVRNRIVLFGLFNRNNLFFFVITLTSMFLVFFYGEISSEAIFSTFLIAAMLGVFAAGYFALNGIVTAKEMFLFDRKNEYKRILHESSPLVLGSSLMMIMNWSDTFLIGSFMTPTDVGYYNIIFRISSIATIFLSVINTVIVPKLSLLYKEDKRKLEAFVRKSNRYIFILTSIILIIIVLFAENILRLFGNADISLLKLPLIIMIVGYFINAYCGTIGYLLQMTGYARVFQNIILVATVMNILINIFLIPRYGIMGAAIASTVSMAFWNIVGTFIVNRKLKINTIFFK